MGIISVHGNDLSTFCMFGNFQNMILENMELKCMTTIAQKTEGDK